MNWLRNFMYGRYGGDQLTRALIILSFILMVIPGYLPSEFSGLIVVAYIPTFIAIFRTLSRNIYKRRQENYKYLKFENAAIAWFKQKSKRVKESKTHKYFTCPECKQKLRVPRGSGKITVTCPKCKRSFKGKA